MTKRGRASLVEGDTEFDTADATLLRTVDRTGSVSKASTELGRSRARALWRIETLEDAFGELVERRRGGSGGGGSQITDNGRELLTRYDRLEAALAATAQVPETVLRGTVTATRGELASVDTPLGELWGLHDGLAVDDAVQVRIGGDAVTLYDGKTDLDSQSTSAQNRLRGRVGTVDRGETVLTVRIDAAEMSVWALLTDESAETLGVEVGRLVGITWKATATRLIPIAEPPESEPNK